MILIILMFILILSLLFYKITNLIKYKQTLQKEIQNDSLKLNKIKQEISLQQIQKNDNKKTLQFLHNEQNKVKKQLNEKQQNLNNYYNTLKNQALSSFNQYFYTIEKSYEAKEKEYNLKINNIKKQQEQIENKLLQIKQTYKAAVDARIREKEQKNKKLFYQIQITEKQISDIHKLQKWKKELNDPSVVSKIIWSSYIMKPTSDLCNRVLGSNTICGIYKITNLLTNDIYIGQSVNISDRWKTHIKSGLGINTSSTNKLYNNMQQYGVWQFSFEVLQVCSREKLNEKESFWIEMYQSNKVGLNIQKGGK